MQPLIDLTRRVLQPYHNGNKNTGNVYEIAFALFAMRRMGLTDDDLDALDPYFSTVREHNPKFTEAFITYLKSQPVGNGITLRDSQVKDIRNVTQDDADGKTGDFIFVLYDGREYSISVEEGGPSRAGEISKCLTNPSCRRFGCTNEMIAEFKGVAATAVNEFKAEMTSKHGTDMDAWPSRQKSAAQAKAISHIAAKTCDHFNALPLESQATILEDLLQIKDGQKPADYIALVPKTLKSFSLWSFGDVKIHPGEYALKVAGDYLTVVHRETSDIIGKTQVKFNNGVWKKGRDGVWRTSSATSSWNGNFTLTKVFEMNQVSL
jgi:hypothetical protein